MTQRTDVEVVAQYRLDQLLDRVRAAKNTTAVVMMAVRFPEQTTLWLTYVVPT